MSSSSSLSRISANWKQDTDKGGNISVEEFGRVMKSSGQNPTEAELAQIIKDVDIDGDGTINFDGTPLYF